MNEPDNFALVRKPSNAVEKAAPGEKRILSGMVAETLVVAREQKLTNSSDRDDAESEKWYLIGEKYYLGEGVAKDAIEAVKWLRKAAERNHVKAQTMLGNCYSFEEGDYFGEGVTKDYKEAVKWYCKAADKNDSGAEFRLGYCYREGKGVAKDYKEAVKWFRKAAEHGSGRQAEYNMGVIYEKGEGVARDYSEAVKWYRKAAEKDHAQAQHNLGVCYEKGHGVQQDFPEAYKLYKLVANNRMWPFDNREIIAGILKRILARMTAVEIAEGERRYHEFCSSKHSD
jgi:TPR repeat protein